MVDLFWQTSNEGSRDLVLLHGWGLNAEVWRSIEMRCASHFRLHHQRGQDDLIKKQTTYFCVLHRR